MPGCRMSGASAWLADGHVTAAKRCVTRSPPSAPSAARVETLSKLQKASLLVLQMLEDLREEAGKYGELVGIAAPLPPPTITALEPARVYLKYSQLSESAAAKEVFHGRTFDDNTISARYAPEMEYVQAEAGIFDAHINSGLAPGMAAPGMSAAAGQMAPPPGMMPAPPPHGMMSAAQLPPPPALPVGGFM